jgi:hypothetical protein
LFESQHGTRYCHRNDHEDCHTGDQRHVHPMLKPQNAGACEHHHQIGDVVRHQTDQHRSHRNLGRDVPSDQAAHHEHRAADAAARQHLIGENLGDAERNQGP